MNDPAPWRSIMASVVDRQPFKVGGATVDPVSRDACWRGGKERLQPQTLKVLRALVSHHGDVITRDELVQLCWDGRAVSDDVINRAILLLRHLAEHAGGFKIVTVPRTGYRLVELESSPNSALTRRWVPIAIVLAISVVGIAVLMSLHRQPASQGTPPAPNISIMPFVAEGNDALVRQVAHAVPVSLSHMLAQSGFAIVRDDPAAPNAARSEYVFSGNVRRTATSVEASLQLTSKHDGTIAFAHDFSAPIGRAADLPDRIGATAAAELAWTGAEMVLDPREQLKPEIASELMNSISLTIEDGNSLRAYQLARHAALLAPQSAIAQLTLAIQTAFSISSIPRDERAEAVELGRRAGARARDLAPEFGDVYLTWCLLHSPVRMSECDASVRRALKVDPSSSFLPGYLSSLSYNAGRVEEALQLADQSLANDPYKPAKLSRMIRILEASGRSDDAERVFREARRLWPDSRRMRAGRLLGMAERGNYAGLAAFMDPIADAPMLDPASIKALLAARAMHDLPEARRACGNEGLKPFTLGLCMTILSDLGDPGRSFAIAAILYPAWHAASGKDDDRIWFDHPDGFATALLTGSAAQAMRRDPRFLGMAERLGLLSYWRSRRPDFCTKTNEPICANIIGNSARF